MGRKIKINWADLHSIKSKFLDNSKEIEEIKKEIDEIYASLDNAWRGYDASLFKAKGLEASAKLSKEAYYLSSWYNFSSKAANKYIENVENGMIDLNRIDALHSEDETNQ